MRQIDLKNLKWICRPQRYAEIGGKLILETEPFTDLRPAGKSAEAIELSFSPEGSFCFTMRVDFDYQGVFDQCGMILYNGKERKALLGTECMDEELTRLQCTVFHGGKGDRSLRDIGSKIRTMYYRTWYRGGAVRMQYSFSGKRYSDFREFRIDPKETVSLGIFACSPGDSYFDCTFSGMSLQEEENRQ
ncbi:MAG: DUF1349 domain-containing protein [Solobacterium sp.]|nr:DUF1349 domain-containing protein [Solobacterium sp.]